MQKDRQRGPLIRFTGSQQTVRILQDWLCHRVAEEPF